MAKLTRYTQTVFGSTAGSNQIAEFGSLAANVPARYTGSTITPALVQGLSNYLTGWFGAVIGGNSPAIEDMNALCYLYAYQLTYLMQEGIPEYDSATIYFTGSIVNSSGILYVSLQDNNTGNALTNTSYWNILIAAPTWLAKSTSYSLAASDSSVGFTTGSSALTATLPTAVGLGGQEKLIKKIDSGTGTVQLLTTLGQTVDGYASGKFLLASQNDFIRIRSDNANWQVVGIQNPVAFYGVFPGTTVSAGNSIPFPPINDTYSGYTAINETYTVPFAGYYLITCCLTSSGATNVLLNKNGVFFANLNFITGSGTPTIGSLVVPCAAGDALTVISDQTRTYSSSAGLFTNSLNINLLRN